MKKLFSKLKSTKGFTLVEMIVVMAVIGILVALLAPNVATLIGNAKETSDDAKVKNVSTSLAAYNTKQIKDGLIFTPPTTGVNGDYDGDGATDYVIPTTVTDINTLVQGLWVIPGGAATTEIFVGGGGYLPANVLATDETLYLYVSANGTVLGVAYTDAGDRVKSVITYLSTDASGALSSAGAVALDNAQYRGSTTTNGAAFTVPTP